MTILESAAAFLAVKLSCDPKFTTKLAGELLQNGILAWNGASFTLDDTSPYLLRVAPGLIAARVLPTLVSTDPAARLEIQRRLEADPSLAELKNHMCWSESSVAGGSGLSESDVASLEDFVTRETARREAQGAAQIPGVRDAEVRANIAASRTPTPSAAAAKDEVSSNIRDLFAGIQTDLQRNGFPPSAA